jgi:hypothetical protein
MNTDQKHGSLQSDMTFLRRNGILILSQLHTSRVRDGSFSGTQRPLAVCF